VRTYDASEVLGLLGRPEFDAPVTAASRTRRLSYVAEARRKQVAASWGDDYDGFLRSCTMTMRIGGFRPQQRLRCQELIHRSNQLNLSARRYSDQEFDRLTQDANVECFGIECADKFGDYGLVGFASVDISSSVPTLMDLVLSCRVAQKRVEETFVYWYALRARERGARRLRAALVPTDRNKPIRDALGRLPFRVLSDEGARQILELPLDESVKVPDVVRVEEDTLSRV